MRDELVNILIEKYPSLFSLKDDKTEPIGAYSIECDDGWFDILDSLCFMITQQEKNVEGNNQYRISQNQEPVVYEPFRFTQIKEKFGGLRAYYYGGNEYIRGLVGMAENWSYHTCEKCGAKGSPDKRGWIMTLCETCKGQR